MIAEKQQLAFGLTLREYQGQDNLYYCCAVQDVFVFKECAYITRLVL